MCLLFLKKNSDIPYLAYHENIFIFIQSVSYFFLRQTMLMYNTYVEKLNFHNLSKNEKFNIHYFYNKSMILK